MDTQTPEKDWNGSVLVSACREPPPGTELSPSTPTLWSAGESVTGIRTAMNLWAGMPPHEALYRAEFNPPPSLPSKKPTNSQGNRASAELGKSRAAPRSPDARATAGAAGRSPCRRGTGCTGCKSCRHQRRRERQKAKRLEERPRV